MNKIKIGEIAVLVVAAMSGLALSAPASTASSPSPDGYALKDKSMGAARTDALAQKNVRMAKCKSMQGDEKKSCENRANADVKKAEKHGSFASRRGVKTVRP